MIRLGGNPIARKWHSVTREKAVGKLANYTNAITVTKPTTLPRPSEAIQNEPTDRPTQDVVTNQRAAHDMRPADAIVAEDTPKPQRAGNMQNGVVRVITSNAQKLN